MSPRFIKIGVLVAAVAAVAGGGAAYATAGGGGDSEIPISGAALDKAEAAALAHTGGGRVTGTEVGDEESYYEVEVTLDGGQQVDVQLDESFDVVGSETDTELSGDENEDDRDRSGAPAAQLRATLG